MIFNDCVFPLDKVIFCHESPSDFSENLRDWHSQVKKQDWFKGSVSKLFL